MSPRYQLVLNHQDDTWVIWILFIFTTTGCHGMNMGNLAPQAMYSFDVHGVVEFFTFSLTICSSVVTNPFERRAFLTW
jgi:hypothetical protein